MYSPRARIISLFFVFPTVPSTEKAQKFGENRPELAQGHYVQWHRLCTAQTQSNDTNGSPCCMDSALWSCANRVLGQSTCPPLPSFVTLRKLIGMLRWLNWDSVCSKPCANYNTVYNVTCDNSHNKSGPCLYTLLITMTSSSAFPQIPEAVKHVPASEPLHMPSSLPRRLLHPHLLATGSFGRFWFWLQYHLRLHLSILKEPLPHCHFLSHHSVLSIWSYCICLILMVHLPPQTFMCRGSMSVLLMPYLQPLEYSRCSKVIYWMNEQILIGK